MRTVLRYGALIVALMVSFAWSAAAQTAGDAQAGKALWTDYRSTQCVNCHGARGEGGFGPDLAAIVIARASLVKAAPRLESAALFCRNVVAHLLCPDIKKPILSVRYG